MESPAPFINSAFHTESTTDRQLESPGSADSSPIGEESTTNGLLVESNLVSDSEVEKSLDALADDSSTIQRLSEEAILEAGEQNPEDDSQGQYILEQDDGLETEPEYFAAGTESQMSELLDRDSASLLLEERQDEENLADVISLEAVDKAFPDTDQPETSDQEPDHPEPEKPLAEEEPPAEPHSTPAIEEDAAPRDSVDDFSRFTFEEEYETPKPNKYRYYWMLGSLLLLLPLGGQITWYARDSLVNHELGRDLLQGLCSIARCQVPIRRNTEQIVISERALTTHPEKQDVLSLKLEMVNAAAFQQPFPRLQLSLYNDMGKLIARRTFLPHEYRSEPDNEYQMMPKLKAVQVELELLDPGNEVTGFKFDFL